MVVVLKSSKDIGRVKELLANANPQKKFDAKRFCGVLKTDEDALKVQLRLRNEWE